MESLLNPSLPANIDAFYQMLVSVAGVLLGIAFAAMLFILQSGFSSFKFSRRMFVLLYLYFGKQVLLSLAYLTIMPFFVLYLPESEQLIALFQLTFCLFFLISAFDYAKEEGYIITLQSHKFVPPQYGKLRSYFRYISNRGVLRNLVHLSPPIFVVAYPYVLSSKVAFSLNLNETAMFYSCLLVLAYTLFKLTMFVPEFFIFTDMEFKSAHKLNDGVEQTDDDKLKNEKELEHLKEYLINHGVSELKPACPREFMGGELTVYLNPSNNGVAHFNFYIYIKNTTPSKLKEQVAIYGYEFAKRLMNSKSDVTQYVMSYHVNISGDKQRNLFFRFDQHDLQQAESQSNSPMCIYHLKNVCIDELFR